MIQVSNLTKVFRLPHAQKKTLYHNILSLAGGNYSYEKLFALNNISFAVRQGEFVGIIGKNGSGKSTLLKVLSRIYVPTSGSVKVEGDLYPLLELGIGFQPDFTVRDNLYIYGSFLGFTRKEMNLRLSEILGYAELERFADAKLDHLSSGMKVRLAFSIAMQAEASTYIVDEVLAVGDRWFMEKCRKEFARLKSEKKTVLFVSHAEADILEFSDRVIVLEQGKIANMGKPSEMVSYYNSLANS